jgi:hypothetical protein
MPRSACARAAASLTPSPTIATTAPCRLQPRTSATFCGGQHVRRARRRGRCPPLRRHGAGGGFVVAGEQHRPQPEPRRRAMAAALDGFTVSATAMVPCSCPSARTATTVRPRSPGTSSAARGRPRRDDLRRLPGAHAGQLRKSVAIGISMPSWRAPRTMAAAIGCSLLSSTAAARRQQVVGCARRSGCTLTTSITPVVTVPVLSSTIVSTRRVLSSTSGPLIRMPICAPRPVPTSSAVGVARPSAQGQAMMSTATAGPSPARGCRCGRTRSRAWRRPAR